MDRMRKKSWSWGPLGERLELLLINGWKCKAPVALKTLVTTHKYNLPIDNEWSHTYEIGKKQLHRCDVKKNHSTELIQSTSISNDRANRNKS